MTMDTETAMAMATVMAITMTTSTKMAPAITMATYGAVYGGGDGYIFGHDYRFMTTLVDIWLQLHPRLQL